MVVDSPRGPRGLCGGRRGVQVSAYTLCAMCVLGAAVLPRTPALLCSMAARALGAAANSAMWIAAPELYPTHVSCAQAAPPAAPAPPVPPHPPRPAPQLAASSRRATAPRHSPAHSPAHSSARSSARSSAPAAPRLHVPGAGAGSLGHFPLRAARRRARQCVGQLRAARVAQSGRHQPRHYSRSRLRRQPVRPSSPPRLVYTPLDPSTPPPLSTPPHSLSSPCAAPCATRTAGPRPQASPSKARVEARGLQLLGPGPLAYAGGPRPSVDGGPRPRCTVVLSRPEQMVVTDVALKNNSMPPVGFVHRTLKRQPAAAASLK